MFVSCTIAAVPRWLLIEDLIEDTETATLHRPDCGEVDRTRRLELHRAGALLTRSLAPSSCWTCEPLVEMKLAV
jgi:hypothetical protein